ncbi:hypothetical protein BQ8794_230086 [Mesorhizobium prunaredense]|uniref:Uncharacterized protein n=1 Tax=Mesorhizobium prunaredense TaxID=1631249 RepID=A0A1R3V797_9HYPH|nr:hypothetical protein BQ8794_230086 [Mesorhizobium prunaredense]
MAGTGHCYPIGPLHGTEQGGDPRQNTVEKGVNIAPRRARNAPAHLWWIVQRNSVGRFRKLLTIDVQPQPAPAYTAAQRSTTARLAPDKNRVVANTALKQLSFRQSEDMYVITGFQHVIEIIDMSSRYQSANRPFRMVHIAAEKWFRCH